MKFLNSVSIFLILLILVTSCDKKEDIINSGKENKLKKAYTEAFISRFGEFDKTQDWNTAMQVAVEISFVQSDADSCNVQLFTAPIGDDNCYRLAKFTAKDKVQFSVDVPKSQSQLNVVVRPIKGGVYGEWGARSVNIEKREAHLTYREAEMQSMTESQLSTEVLPQRWVLACNDMTSVGDFQYNDIVVSVYHLAGQKTATMRALAVGSEEEVFGYYNIDIPLNGGKEFHQWLAPNAAKDQMINVYGFSVVGDSFTYEVDDPWNYTIAGSKMGDITFAVGDNKSYWDRVNGETEWTKGRFYAPQMLCLPYPWAWPSKYTDIHMAYPYFLYWVEDGTKGADWYKTTDSQMVIMPK